MKVIVLLLFIMLSCGSKTEKYYIRSEGLDGNRCEKFELSYYGNFEIAQCAECKLHFISPIKDFLKYKKYFKNEVGLLYIKNDSNLATLCNKKFMFNILNNWSPSNIILSIHINDSIVLLETINNSLYSQYKIK